MKFKIKSEILLTNLNYVSRAVSSKNIIPILSGIMFDLTEEGLNLVASDESLLIKCNINKEDIEEIKEIGSIVIPGRYILDIIRKLPNNTITIETDGLKILIKSKSGEYNLNGMDSKEFPNYNIELNKHPLIINQKDLSDIISQASFSCSTQEARPILTGINIKIENDVLEAVATDSYRLSKKVIKIDNQDNNIDIVIPKLSLVELKNILNEKDKIELHVFNNKIIFKLKNILFQSRLLNGTYPSVNSLIPNEYSIEVTTSLDELYNVIDRTSLLSDGDKNIIQMEVKDNEIITTCFSQQVGAIEEHIIIDQNNQNNFKIAFNSKYMLEALKSFSGEKVKIGLTSEIKPFIIKDIEDNSLIQLIVPIRTY